MKFYQGYSKPLYLQPLYQKQILFKHGYPFSAPANSKCKKDYKKGICPIAEKLHFEEIVINEHIRFPHLKSDINDIITSVSKICSN